jgi:hypothetical protein
VPELIIGGCSTVEWAHSIVETALKTEKVVFLPISPFNAMIDFVYRNGSVLYAFQSTIAAKHDSFAGVYLRTG